MWHHLLQMGVSLWHFGEEQLLTQVISFNKYLLPDFKNKYIQIFKGLSCTVFFSSLLPDLKSFSQSWYSMVTRARWYMAWQNFDWEINWKQNMYTLAKLLMLRPIRFRGLDPKFHILHVVHLIPQLINLPVSADNLAEAVVVLQVSLYKSWKLRSIGSQGPVIVKRHIATPTQTFKKEETTCMCKGQE